MPGREPVVLDFDEQHRAPVVERMVAMAAAGAGWVNLSPGLDVDEPPPRSLLSSLIGGRGPTVPLATWTTPGGRRPAQVGVEHGQGPRALEVLAERGVPLPPGWQRVQDHAKRGIVVVPPPAVTADALDEVLDWMLRAAGALCPLPRTGEWRAYCYGG
ncbi:MAG TPA: hypothetical protein VKZ72_09035 [Acidimicrobiales bacterium]|nr:hypothetical protein [Acidimicrobiales bacterium]